MTLSYVPGDMRHRRKIRHATSIHTGNQTPKKKHIIGDNADNATDDANEPADVKKKMRKTRVRIELKTKCISRKIRIIVGIIRGVITHVWSPVPTKQSTTILHDMIVHDR